MSVSSMYIIHSNLFNKGCIVTEILISLSQCNLYLTPKLCDLEITCSRRRRTMDKYIQGPALLRIPRTVGFDHSFEGFHLFLSLPPTSMSLWVPPVPWLEPLSQTAARDEVLSFPRSCEGAVTPTLQHINHTGNVARDTLYPVLLSY